MYQYIYQYVTIHPNVEAEYHTVSMGEDGHHGVISLTDVSSSVEGSTTTHLLSQLTPLSRTTHLHTFEI